MEKSISLLGNTLHELIRNVASDSPTPGGGSISVVSATLGLSLVIMAAEISKKNNSSTGLENLITEAKKASECLSLYADKDVEVFNRYMFALKLPKNNDEERQVRKEAIQAAVKLATESPLEAATEIVKGMKLAKRLLEFIKKEVISDIGAGITLLNASLSAVLLNVDINLSSVKDDLLKKAYNIKKIELLDAGTDIYAIIWDEVKNILRP
ncbi:cyclodeaminase/cyclohydrolase family protein [Mucilaginibacter sp. SG564]|uniref:cyclodeaminase/cyclohydrolase family protein n=1 Tax=Mucilaginibacter sp. SG564 TaxID=2587022 RepID=UPI0015538C0C|nr:cyclodeaminase/cyclohydrolase family protein [Mucilaginibacter sp. SG564]NOW96080.1 formiminotetrahydrofolate cyclodeaminase [Mucilaginibacter sp. SG564]